MWPVRLATVGNPGGGLIVGVDFEAAIAATNYLLIALSLVIALAREAMVDVIASSVSDFTTAAAASAHKELRICPVIVSRNSSRAFELDNACFAELA